MGTSGLKTDRNSGFSPLGEFKPGNSSEANPGHHGGRLEKLASIRDVLHLEITRLSPEGN